jgi:hypothetical protein
MYYNLYYREYYKENQLCSNKFSKILKKYIIL